MDAALFLLMIVLFLLQFTNGKIPRVVVSAAVVALSVVVVGDYQMKLYVCNSEQRSIARMFQSTKPTDDLTWAINAANRYWLDKEKYGDGEPNDRSYASYIREEPNIPDIDYD